MGFQNGGLGLKCTLPVGSCTLPLAFDQSSYSVRNDCDGEKKNEKKTDWKIMPEICATNIVSIKSGCGTTTN